MRGEVDEVSYDNASYYTGVTMTTGKGSNSARHPGWLKNKQAFFFDGIRYSLGMTTMAYNRLRQTLYSLYSLTTGDMEKKENISAFTSSAMVDAWSIIDSVHRFRSLLMQTPGIKQKAPELRIFYDKTKNVEDLRNTIQHLRNEAQGFLAKNLPALGILTWVVLLKPNDKSASLYSLVTGTLYPNVVYPIVNPLGKRIQSPVDHITIILGKHSACLSDVIKQVEQVKLWIEQTSGKHLGAEPALLIRAELTFGKDKSGEADNDR